MLSPAVTPLSPTNPFAESVSTNPFESDGYEEAAETPEVKEQVRTRQKFCDI